MVRILINMHRDQSDIGFAIKNTVRAMERAFDFELRKAGTTLSQARVIRALVLGKDGMSQKEIAESIGVEAPTLVPIIDKMVHDRLVERRQDAADRRNNRIYLTAKSRALWGAIEEAMAHVRRIAQKGIPRQDMDTLLQVLGRMAENATAYLESQAVAQRVR